METQKRKHRKYCAFSQVPSYTADLISDAALVHVFFESVSAPVLSGTQLPRFPDQGRLFGGSFSLLIHLLDVWRPRLYYHFFRSSSGEDEDLLPISKQRK